MPVSVSLIRKISAVEPPLREVLLAILEEIEKQRAQFEQQVTKTEFNELKEIVRELAEAQKRTEVRVEELVEAQKKTEQEIAKLAKGLRQNRKEIGGLARSVAYALENEAYRHLPALLKSKHKIELLERIIRCDVAGEEINIFAKAREDGREIYLVGEAVLKLDDMAKLRQVWKKVEVVKEEYGGEVRPIIVTHFAKPEILEKANKAGILVVQSFEWI